MMGAFLPVGLAEPWRTTAVPNGNDRTARITLVKLVDHACEPNDRRAGLGRKTA